jgi:formamidopyrimidine-DNA glycosylase
MPELPEVETIRRGLKECLVGHVVKDVEIRLSKQFSGDVDHVVGAKVIGVRRFGKGLVIDLSNGYSLAIHVKMTGQLVVGGWQMFLGRDRYPNKWTHVIFKFKSPSRDFFLYYSDVRQFGWIRVVKTSELVEQSFFKDLGPEPLKDLTRDKFFRVLERSKMPIKLLLMDQKKIAGIGNIYANDALFVAKIHPKRVALSLGKEERLALFEAVERVLKKGIEVGGASEWNYVNAFGEKGNYQNFFQVYNKEGKLCSRCEGMIEKIRMGGRGTFFCAGCQV